MSLVRCAVAEVAQGDVVIASVLVGKCQPRTQRRRCADDAVPAIEMLFDGEHVHGAALALGVTASAAGELCHYAFGIHTGCQHMAMVAIGRDHLVSGFQVGLHPHDHRFLTDIEMAEATDMPHAIELTGLLLKAADQQHHAEGVKPLLACESFGRRRLPLCSGRRRRLARRRAALVALHFGWRHWASPGSWL